MGVQDIFVSFMLWFVMENNDKPLFMEDGKTGELYQVLNVLKDPLDSDTYFEHDISIKDNINDETIDDAEVEARLSFGDSRAARVLQ